MLGVIVKGGTGAGSKRPKRSEPWTCECGIDAALPVAKPRGWFGAAVVATGTAGPGDVVHVERMHPGSRYSCPDCGARRP